MLGGYEWEENFMWENLTIALCLLGFVGALTLMLVELPVVVAQAQQGTSLPHAADTAPPGALGPRL
jgi:hypothetical protein